MEIPARLQRYVVEQHYEKYTSVDQAVWRFVLRQLRNFLKTHAHETYLEGLEKTGIEIERIPKIADISEKISKFGWRAIPVSGFIPPAAFMELQSLSILPIASDMRTLEHLEYTPAPDIVHEAAGHAPILANPEFAQYLKDYAQVARKAILSKEDLELYEAIRHLSDIKEDPTSTKELIAAAQERLDRTSKSMSHVSEAAELARMNWWTAEYGLIGSLENPKIFGAGLLSSVGEARWCLSARVKKIPLTVDCIHQAYDITEPQPQLFVTPDFKTLSKVLNEMADGMAFRTGGMKGLQKALHSKTVNTVQWDSGLQASGELAEVLADSAGNPAYLRFQGPTQLCFDDQELPGHSKSYHKDGFGAPVGPVRNQSLMAGEKSRVEFQSGVLVEGIYEKSTVVKGHGLLHTFRDARVTFNGRTLFEPSWGAYDMAVGASIVSVFGGPADRGSFGETDDFVAARVPQRQFSDEELRLQKQYQHMRELRENEVKGDILADHVEAYLMTHDQHFPEDWLYRVEALELVLNRGPRPSLEKKIREDLARIQSMKPVFKDVIADGIQLANQI